MKTRSLFPAWGILIFSVPIFLAAALLMRGGSVTLDRAADTCTFHSPSFFWHHDNTVALHDVDYATLRTKHASSYIAVVLVNGDDQFFADSSDQDGKGRAIKAINDYLGVHQSRR